MNFSNYCDSRNFRFSINVLEIFVIRAKPLVTTNNRCIIKYSVRILERVLSEKYKLHSNRYIFIKINIFSELSYNLVDDSSEFVFRFLKVYVDNHSKITIKLHKNYCIIQFKLIVRLGTNYC